MRRVNFWVSAELLAAFDQVVKERDLTRTQLLRRVMADQVLRRHEADGGTLVDQVIEHTVDLNGRKLVFPDTPALVCTVCGSVYFRPEIVDQLQARAKTAVSKRQEKTKGFAA